MSTFSQLWMKLAKSKKYREEFVASQVKRGIPFQIRAMIKRSGLAQEEIASRAGITQGVISRAANPDYGNLTLNTLIRIAAGFDVAFVGKFVPFSELGRWFVDLSEESVMVKPFPVEDAELALRLSESSSLNIGDYRAKQRTETKGTPMTAVSVVPSGNEDVCERPYFSAAASQAEIGQSLWSQRPRPGAQKLANDVWERA